MSVENDRARFLAREFVARWYRETGAAPNLTVSDCMHFAYEMGYLRGHGDGLRAAGLMHDEIRKKVNDEAK